ncbi:TPA: hypothetical protein UOA81_000853 [Stenotrophomonas maltophilia]|nr:hypothetical protein [Stenotrophomonas maltophilia]
MNVNTEKQYSWSTDEERFHDQCDSVEAAIAAAIDYHGGALEVGSTIYVGEVVEIETRQLVRADSIIEDMQCQAHELSGEAAEDYLASVTEEQQVELEQLVIEWAQRVEKPSFWQVVSMVPHLVTSEHLEAFNA